MGGGGTLQMSMWECAADMGRVMQQFDTLMGRRFAHFQRSFSNFYIWDPNSVSRTSTIALSAMPGGFQNAWQKMSISNFFLALVQDTGVCLGHCIIFCLLLEAPQVWRTATFLANWIGLYWWSANFLFLLNFSDLGVQYCPFSKKKKRKKKRNGIWSGIVMGPVWKSSVAHPYPIDQFRNVFKLMDVSSASA